MSNSAPHKLTRSRTWLTQPRGFKASVRAWYEEFRRHVRYHGEIRNRGSLLGVHSYRGYLLLMNVSPDYELSITTHLLRPKNSVDRAPGVYMTVSEPREDHLELKLNELYYDGRGPDDDVVFVTLSGKRLTLKTNPPVDLVAEVWRAGIKVGMQLEGARNGLKFDIRIDDESIMKYPDNFGDGLDTSKFMQLVSRQNRNGPMRPTYYTGRKFLGRRGFISNPGPYEQNIKNKLELRLNNVKKIIDFATTHKFRDIHGDLIKAGSNGLLRVLSKDPRYLNIPIRRALSEMIELHLLYPSTSDELSTLYDVIKNRATDGHFTSDQLTMDLQGLQRLNRKLWNKMKVLENEAGKAAAGEKRKRNRSSSNLSNNNRNNNRPRSS